MESLLNELNQQIDELVAQMQAEQHWQYIKPLGLIRTKIAQLHVSENKDPLQTPA